MSSFFISHRTKFFIVVGLLLIFIGRLFYGMTKFSGQDEFQVYLIGLKYATTHVFPYWGADISHTHSRLSGALQGLLVGLPLRIFQDPISPYILLNILSFSALLYFSWYISKRLPDIPRWLIYAWLLTAPWTLHFSTHIENPSYVLFGSIIFFVGIFELFPIYQYTILRSELAFFCLGFALFWIAQLHMSWVLLLPYICLSFYFQRRDFRKLLRGMAFFLLGCLISGSLLLPGLFRFGVEYSGDTGTAIKFHPANLLSFFTVAARFLSFASYEVARYMGADSSSRLEFLLRNKWIIPFATLLLLIGWSQVGWFVYTFFRKKDSAEWNIIRYFTLGSLLLTWVTFCFTVVKPAAHTYYLMFPVVLWYSFYCYQTIVTHRRFTMAALIILFTGLVFQTALAFDRQDEYGLHRYYERVENALQKRDYTIVGLRREAILESSRMENVWKQSTKEGNLTHYTTDFEYQAPDFIPQNIILHEHYNGTYACKIDSLQPFGLNFKIKTSKLGQAHKINLSLMAKTTALQDLLLITEIKKGEKNIFWKSNSIIEQVQHVGQWQQIQLEIDLPQQLEGDSDLLVYIWQPTKSGAINYVDAVDIVFH